MNQLGRVPVIDDGGSLSHEHWRLPSGPPPKVGGFRHGHSGEVGWDYGVEPYGCFLAIGAIGVSI